jgi:hypothetical protein
MFNLRNIGRTAAAICLGAGLYVSAGIGTATAGIGGPAGLIHSEGGFDFTLFDLGDGPTPFFVGEPFEPIAGGSGGVLGICPGCFDDTPNILSITRPDGALFTMTSLVGAAFGFDEDDGPILADFPDGVDFAVSDIPDPGTPAMGVLTPGLFELHPVLAPFAPELFVFSPDPMDFFESGNCLCFDSMTFLVDFGPGEDIGPFGAAIEEITVTFGAVPEPAAASLLGLGLVGLAMVRRRRQTLRS